MVARRRVTGVLEASGGPMRKIVAAVLLAVTGMAVVMLGEPAQATRGSVASYLRQSAQRLAQPGVYADPAVVASGRLTSGQVTRLRAQAHGRPSQLRVWVLPAARLSVDGRLAYSPRAMIARLHALVGRPGTYALLVAASSRAKGQSFYAYQWPGSGPTYATGKAAHDAIACCAPDYGRVLARFVQESTLRRPGAGSTPSGGTRHRHRHHVTLTGPFGNEGGGGGGGLGAPQAFIGIGVVLVVGVAGIGFLRSMGGRGAPGPSLPSPADVTELRGPLGEEIEQVRQQISAFDASATAGAADPAAAQVAAARAALDQAHTRLTTMTAPADAQAVTTSLADARYELAAGTAVREGRPVPPRTAPCFVDPRHGPSVSTRIYPPSGLTSPVPVCAACDAALAAGTTPAARPLLLGGSQRFAWFPYGPAWWYLTGYWAGQPFLGDLSHHQAWSDGGPGGRHPSGFGPESGGGGFFGGGGGHHGGMGGGGGHHGGGGMGGMGHMGGMGGGHGGGGGFGGGGHGDGGGHHG